MINDNKTWWSLHRWFSFGINTMCLDHVCFNRATLSELLITHPTFISLDVCMCCSMLWQTRQTNEISAAFFTIKWFLPSVCPYMCLEGVGLCEPLIATVHWTGMGLGSWKRISDSSLLSDVQWAKHKWL